MVIAVFVSYALADYVVQCFIIYPEFVALEQDESEKNMGRVLRALKNEIHHLDNLCHDWSAWNDTYAFINTPTDKYIHANLTFSTFVNNNIHLISYLNADGHQIWSEAHNLETGAVIRLPHFEKDHFKSSEPLIAFQTEGQPLVNVKISGIFMTLEGPMLIASRPVLTSNNEGPIRGAVIMGRFLNAKIVENLIKQTLMQFRIIPLSAVSTPQHLQAIYKRITARKPYFVDYSTDDNQLRVYSLYKDIQGNNAFLIQVQIDRLITARGMKIMHQALLSKAIAGLAVLIVILLLLQYTTLKPLDNLRNSILKVGRTGDLTVPLSGFHHDEIGDLAREFDKMLRQLSLARENIAEQSHRYGMSEMATEILHNIRNTLTPLTGKIGLLRERMRKVMVKEIQMVISELEQGDVPDQRRTELMRFSILANKDLIGLIKDTTLKLDAINNITQQTEKMLDDCQFLAYSKRILEPVQIKNLIADSLRRLRADLLQIITVKIDLKDAKCELLYTDRIALLKVFVIVLTNATESVQRRGLGRGKVKITIEALPEESDNMTAMRICDNGEGIRAKRPELIFQRNFSTQTQSLSVFGLHWCANTITALGGRMYAANRKTGQGACIHIILPRNSL